MFERDKRSVLGCMAAIVVAAALVLFIGVPLYRGVVRHKVSAPDLAQVSSRTGLAFPAGATLLHSCLDRPRFPPGQWALFAVVRLPAADVKGFLGALPPGHRVSNRDRLGVDDPTYHPACPAPEWWTPARPRSFVAARVPAASVLSQPARLLVSLDDRRAALVYVVAASNR